MIDPNIIKSFTEEIAKLAGAADTAGKVKALLAGGAVLGAGGGIIGKQAYDDMQVGKQIRKQQRGM